ncbi:MAG: caspase family protein [Anaeromyxobacter sp.]
MTSARAVALALCLAAAGLAAAPARATPAGGGAGRRFALVVGEPDGGPGAVRLRYAERDARRIHGILTEVGGVRPEDARLLLSAGAPAFRRALAELSAAAGRASAAGERTVLVVYYSGHARDGALRLGTGALPLDELREALASSPADVRIGLLDSCRSGAIVRAKGVRPAPTFDVKTAQPGGPRGLVLVASSSADEDSQESDAIGASYFTHHLASGLLGGADTSGDGLVTLAEAYAYAYARTVGATASSAAGVQHPVFLYDLGGAGDVVLTELKPAAGGVVLPAAAEGLYVVLDGAGRAVAEVAKAAGAERRIALAPGKYLVKKRLPDESGLLVARLEVAGGPVPVEDARMDRVPLDRDPQKGFGGARFALLLGVGGQRFFEGKGKTGLFPPAGLGGFELAARDDLGHGLVWGLDAAVGGGKGAVGLGGGVSVPFDFALVGGGVGLWKEWGQGAVGAQAGVRLGATYLARRFAAEDALPRQHFFTVTPGLIGAVGWRMTPRLSAVARARVAWLFYNVDSNQSLGFVEGLVGVEYALGD